MKQKLFEVICKFCEVKFLVKRKFYLDKLRDDENHNFFCSKKCLLENKKTGKEKECLQCSKNFYVVHSNLNESKFCSSSCSALFNNNLRVKNGFTTKGRVKNFYCNSCNELYIGSIHTDLKKSYCDKCSLALQKKRIKNYNNKIIRNIFVNEKCNFTCIKCNQSIDHRGKYCNSCRTQVLSINRINAIINGKTNFKSIKCEYSFKNDNIKCDSKLEYACLDFFVKNFDVLSIERNSNILPYVFEGKNKNYVPVFKIKTIDSIYIVECKGIVYSDSLNKKWHFYNESSVIKKNILEDFCTKNGFKSFWFTPDKHSSFYKNLKIKK